MCDLTPKRTESSISGRQSWWFFHVIPRHTFADDAAYEAFFQELQSKGQSPPHAS